MQELMPFCVTPRQQEVLQAVIDHNGMRPAAKGGWISGRDAKVITHSKKHGEVSRLTINPEMVEAA